MKKYRITNEKVLVRVNEKRNLRRKKICRRQKKNWMEHILMDNLLRDILEGKIDGKRGRGRPRIGMVSDLM